MSSEKVAKDCRDSGSVKVFGDGKGSGKGSNDGMSSAKGSKDGMSSEKGSKVGKSSETDSNVGKERFSRNILPLPSPLCHRRSLVSSP